MRISMKALSCALAAALLGCGEDAGTTVTDVSSGLKALATTLENVVPKGSTRGQLTQSRAHLEDIWLDTDYAIEASNPVRTTIVNYFSPYSQAADNYYSFRNRINGELAIPCVAGYYVGNNGLQLNVGTFTPTFNWGTDSANIIAQCPVDQEFFTDDNDGMNPTIVVSDVSGEANSQYLQKMTIDFDGDTNIDVAYYFNISATQIRIHSAELNGGSNSKSTTLVDYNISTGAIRAEYLTGQNDAHAPTDEGIRLFSDGTQVHWFSYMWKDADRFFTMHFSYLANSASEMAASVTSDIPGAGNDLSNAAACVLFSGYTVRRDNSIACEIDGKLTNNFDSFVTGTLTQTPFTFHDNHSSSRVVSFTTQAEMYSQAPTR